MEETQTPIPNIQTSPRPKSNKKFIIPIIILSAATLALGGSTTMLLLQQSTPSSSAKLQQNTPNSPVKDNISPEKPADNTDVTNIATWNLAEASALTASDAARIKSLYSDEVNFDVNEITGKKNIYNSPIYPYQFMSVSDLPYKELTDESNAFGAAIFAYRTSPTAEWQEGFGAQAVIGCEALSKPSNTDLPKAFAAFECYFMNESEYEITTTLGAYNALWKSSLSTETATK